MDDEARLPQVIDHVIVVYERFLAKVQELRSWGGGLRNTRGYDRPGTLAPERPANIALIVFAMKIAYTRGFESPYTRAGS